MRVGFVGLGAMGVPMALNLVKAGHAVRGFDVRPGATDALVAAGGSAATSAADTAKDAELLWLMVVSGEQAEAVLFDGGAAAALPKGATVGLGCTQAPAHAMRTAERLQAMGLHTLDAPVSGGTKGANAASLTIMCSGDEAVLQRARPALDAMGSRVYDCGRAAGMGSTAKMINQLLCGVHIAAAAEAMHLAERAGVSTKTMHEIIGVSAGNSWMWGDRGPRMMQTDPAVTSAVDIFVKDLGIVLGEGRALKAGLPLSAAAMQMFLAASGLGHGAADDSQVIRAYRALNGAGPSRVKTVAVPERVWLGTSPPEKRILVLGESWYGDYPEDIITDDGFIRAYLNDDPRASDGMYTKMANASGLQKRAFWEGVMFTNFVQRVGATSDCKPTPADYKAAVPRLERILQEHKPSGVWILGTTQAEHSRPVVERAGIPCEVAPHPRRPGVTNEMLGVSWRAMVSKVRPSKAT